MGRPKDVYYWNQVRKEENGTLKCNVNLSLKDCVSRIKAYVDRIQRKGVLICFGIDRDNDGVQDNIISGSNNSPEAINAMTTLQAEGAREMIKIIGGSINHASMAEGGHKMTAGGSINPQNNNIQPIALLPGSRAEYAVNRGIGGNGAGALNTFQSELNLLVSDLITEEQDIKVQLQWLESRGKKHKRQVDDWLNELQDLKRRVFNMNNTLDQFEWTHFGELEIQQWIDEWRQLDEISQLIKEVRKHKEQKPLVLSNEFVGENFEENVKKTWKLLGDDEVFIIGVHGMGGVGKTFLATYMENDIKSKGTFRDVLWVTVSQDFTIFKLQHDIAETIGVKLYQDDERARATILSSVLKKLEKTVLILDDVWRYIDLQKVGIPLKVKGIKLIITTRLKHVCQQMACLRRSMIKLYRCHGEEGLELFLLKLAYHGTPPPEVLEIARCVANECGGLPLGISVMARTMKGQNDIHCWRHALNKLEKLQMGQEMKEEVLTVLKRSYDNLIEKDLQKCFLHCALLPQFEVRVYMVLKLVESGLLNEKRSLGEIFDEGNVILDKLKHHCLLDEILWFEMHVLLRNMACHISNQSYMVKCNQILRKMPHVREWTSNLEAVSLAGDRIEEIAEGTSPNCPHLSTLILSGNWIRHIPECFFSHMNALTLLDLSDNPRLTCLPNSVSKLTSLTSLVLRGCWRLEYIPPLGELQALSRLDISGCSLHQVPQGLQNLTNLKWLDLSQHMNSMLITLPGGVLSGLTNMQYLDLRACTGIKVEDLQEMTMLECFGGSFINWDDCYHYMQKIQDNGYGSETYLIHYGKLENWIEEDPIYSEFKLRSVRFGDCEELSYLLPNDLTKLFVLDNDQWVCLCSALFSTTGSSLKNIDIKNCTKLKSLFCLSSSCSLGTISQNLESLRLDNLKSLTAICKEDVAGLTQSLSPMRLFSHLKSLYINECHEIEMLMTPALVPQLQNLERLSVWSCDSMKEIFVVSSSGDDDSFNITLPKLTNLYLYDLPQLKFVCKGILVCGCKDILKSIHGCPNLWLPRIHRV